MRKLILLLVALPFLFTSCATVLKRKQYELDISSDYRDSQVEINDSVYKLPATVKVKRSKEDLKVKLITGERTTDFIVKSSPNGAFVYGNLLWMQLCPAAYLLDLTSQKRFYYGHSLDLDHSDSITTIIPPLAKGYLDYFNDEFPTQKGQVNIVISIPYGNHFYITPQGEHTSRTGGFFGAGLGMEYFYRDNKYFKLQAIDAIDFIAPVPAPVTNDGPYETVRSSNVTFTDNFKFRRFTVGYGLAYSKYVWQIVNDDYERALTNPEAHPWDLTPPVKKSSNALGITLNGYHQFTKSFFVGISYTPTFINVKPSLHYSYQHLISLEAVFKLKI